MNIVIPMAGRGSRLIGYQADLPKPLIRIAGKPMIAWAFESLKDIVCNKIIFIVLREHELHYNLKSYLQKLAGPKAKVLLVNDFTEGQLCTVMVAREDIYSNDGVLIAPADTYIESNLAEEINRISPECHGIISVAELPGDRWSFAKADQSGKVVQVAEKVRISNYASTGLYYFSSGREFLDVADEMVRNQEKTRGEYYVIPVYQKYIECGWRIEMAYAHHVWDMGTPESLACFEAFLKSGNN